MRLYLINPTNPFVSIVNAGTSRWGSYRVWKPLGLMVLAGMTPPEWEVSIIDENLGKPDYAALPRPDLVGITAFTSQANRAYEVAASYRRLGVPVVMGGIHATLCREEAEQYVDAIVTGEAEGIWASVLEDAHQGSLKPCYEGGLANIADVPMARHDLLATGYAFGSIQTTRGCPLNCSFCSVTTFNGAHYRQRPILDVVREFEMIHEKYVLVVDDNFIGTRPRDIARAKELLRALAEANLQKEWIAQATINFADDEELLALAAKAGCRGVLIGFESHSPEGLLSLGKKFNLRNGRDFRASVRRIQRHKILVVGSFIIGLDVDGPGIGEQIANAAGAYGLDVLNVLMLTPLPGTSLWKQMRSENRIALNQFPEDWQYYTLTYPVARFKNFSSTGIIDEMISCDRKFYSAFRIARRVCRNALQFRKPLATLASNLSYRDTLHLSGEKYSGFKHQRANPQ